MAWTVYRQAGSTVTMTGRTSRCLARTRLAAWPWPNAETQESGVCMDGLASPSWSIGTCDSGDGGDDAVSVSMYSLSLMLFLSLFASSVDIKTKSAGRGVNPGCSALNPVSTDKKNPYKQHSDSNQFTGAIGLVKKRPLRRSLATTKNASPGSGGDDVDMSHNLEGIECGQQREFSRAGGKLLGVSH